jgi:hypothetical protein
MSRILFTLLVSCIVMSSSAQRIVKERPIKERPMKEIPLKEPDALLMAHRWWKAINPNFMGCNGYNLGDSNTTFFAAKKDICIKGWINNNYTAWATLNDSLVHLGALVNLESISFGNSPTDKVFSYLSKLPNLKSLDALNGLTGASDVTGKGLYILSGIKSIEVLRLNGCRVSDGDVQYLKELPNLKELWLTGWTITDKSMKSISGLSNLRILKLNRTPITDEGLAMIEWPATLVDLNLELTPVTVNSISSLSKIPNLQRLNISNTNIGDDAVDGIIKMIKSKKGFSEIMIYGNQLSLANKKVIQDACTGVIVRY